MYPGVRFKEAKKKPNLKKREWGTQICLSVHCGWATRPKEIVLVLILQSI